ncbi:alkaline phosphatase family protein [Roseateles koreensis]|uniref:phospholipase C n=1 Tax=Roseateles koreensis TaxID=2987526 RepID=A0ABT5KT22_9BURK|nr:alkaline phosphatase family protein [Roseateles koreensis]MDC8786084.1 alkaline phosphatase family protein [Roseateles koreensis]
MTKNIKNSLPAEAAVNVSRRSLLRGGVAAGLMSGVGASILSACGGSSDARWRPTKTVIVILENRSFKELIGSTDMPYLTQLAAASAVLTKSYAAPTPYNVIPKGGVPIAADPKNPTTTSWTQGAQFTHALPARGSQTNYFYQFSGHNQGFLPDWYQQPGSGRMASASLPAFQDQYGNTLVDASGNPAPSFTGEIGISNELITSYTNVSLPFTTPNLGAAIINQGLTFATFSESLPYPSYNDKASNPTGVADGYARRHNPGINWINFPAYGKTVASDKLRFTLPVSSNLAMTNTVDTDGTKYRGFTVDKDGNAAAFDTLPTVSLVVPNNMDNIHTGTLAAADAWLKANIKPYADWALANDALLIVTTDEDGFTDATNGIANVGTDALIAKYYPGKGGSYMYGMDTITTLFFGPTSRVKVGQFASRVDHLNVLATVLDMYGALGTYKADFKAAWSAATHPINAKWVGGTDSVRQTELASQLTNLSPINDIFVA